MSSLKNKEQKFTNILDNINDPSFYTKHKNNIKAFFKDPAALEILKEKLTEGKRYSVIKLIDKLELKMNDTLYLNYFNYPENINLQIYQMLFNLFTKELISQDILEKIRKIFEKMNDHQKILIEAEKRCIFKKIEIDRHFMKKERVLNEKVMDYSEEKKKLFDQVTQISRLDFSGIKGINLYPKIIYMIDLTFFFASDKKHSAEQKLYIKIENLSRNYFQKPERNNVFLSCLDPSLFQKTIQNDVKRQKTENKVDDKEYWIEFLVRNYGNVLKNKSNYDLLNQLRDKFKLKLHNLRKSVKLLQEKGYTVYFISESSLKHFLSELAVFGIDYIDLKNIISYKYHRIDEVCIEIKKREIYDQIVLFGSLTNIERDYLYLYNKIEKLNEVALKVEHMNECA